MNDKNGEAGDGETGEREAKKGRGFRSSGWKRKKEEGELKDQGFIL